MSTVPFVWDAPTILSLGAALGLMPLAQILSIVLIPRNRFRNRVLFFWHAYDALTHFFIEGSFLYHCFTSFTTIATAHASEPHFLGNKDRLYGPAYGTGFTARLWQEYAKADHRWAGADETVIALELLTVLLGGPAALYVCYQLYVSSHAATAAAARGSAKAKLWLVAAALATAELYGGFMTFAPEWLTGSTQLETGDPMYLWVYLVFFNMLWVFIPIWVLWEAGKEIGGAFARAETLTSTEKQGKKKA